MSKSERTVKSNPIHIVDIITMGCSKNLVDSEKLMTKFLDNGILKQ